jgi:CRISPR/Cas system-associated exonuclease Cas4 (RecB family)
VQFRLLTALREERRLPLEPGKLEAPFERLDQVVQSVAEEYRERLAPAIPRVWEDGVAAIRSDLREWLRRSAEAQGGWVPHRFELSFGLPEHARPTADTASVLEPVRILDRALLRGSIDLVERRSDGTLRVTDHKTGKARVPEDAIIWGGSAMQPVLYALAVEALLKDDVDSGRLYYCTADGDFQERRIPLDDQSRSLAGQAIDTVGRAIEQGFLPAAPERDACRWCDYRQVCGPYEESRTSRKPKDRIAELIQLRDLP